MMTKSKRLMYLLAVMAVTAVLALPARAASGDLDPTFSGNGFALLDAGDLAWFEGVGRQGSKLVAAGSARVGGDFNVLLARFTAQGELDTTFGGGDGQVRVDVAGYDALFDMVVLPSGKILGVGVSVSDTGLQRFLSIRFKPDGDLDGTFGGGDGVVVTTFNGRDSSASAVVPLADGRFVVCGTRYAALDDSAFGLARFKPNGALDDTFGGDGRVVTTLAGYQEHICEGVGVDADGFIVAGGDVRPPGPGPTAAAIIRYRPNGQIDNAFSGGTPLVVQAGLDTLLHDLLVLPGGAALFSGQYRTLNGKYRGYVSKLNPAGGFSSSFANAGWRAVTVPGGDPALYALTLDPNGKVVAAGDWSDNASPYYTHVLVVRLKPGGAFDTSFDGDGIVRFRMTMTDDSAANGVAVQTNGKIVIAGEADPEAGIARLLG